MSAAMEWHWAVLAVLGCSLLFWRALQKARNEGTLPPGTVGWPFIGETVHFMLERGDFIPRRISKYGDVFRTSLGGKGVIVSENPELSKFVLRNEDTFFQADYPRLAKFLGGKWGSISLHGELHKQYRKVVQMTIARQMQGHDFTSYVESCVEAVFSSWVGRTVTSLEGTRTIMYWVSLKVVFGGRLEEGIEEALLQDLEELSHGLDAALRLIPGPAFFKGVKARNRAAQKVKEILESSDSPFLAEVAKGTLTMEQTLDMVVGLLTATIETANRIMALALLLLHETPEVLKLLREENLSILESKACPGLLDSDFKKMKFTRCVIDEVLRFSTVIFPRRVIKDAYFKGYTIPKGWKVLISRRLDDTARFAEPLKFDPSKWLENPDGYETFAFSGGRRICPGMDVAKLVLQVFLHQASTKLSWEPAGHTTVTVFPRLALESGYPMKVEKYCIL